MLLDVNTCSSEAFLKWFDFTSERGQSLSDPASEECLECESLLAVEVLVELTFVELLLRIKVTLDELGIDIPALLAPRLLLTFFN